MFLLKWPLWMSQNVLCSLKDKVHELFYIKRVIGELRMLSQRWMVPLQRQARTKPKSLRVCLFYRNEFILL